MTPDELKQHERTLRDLISNLKRVSNNIQPTNGFSDRVIIAAQQRSLKTSRMTWIRGRFRFTSSVPVRVAYVTILLIAMLGAVPQYNRWIDGFLLGVSSDHIREAKIQQTLWEKNFACATQLDQRANSYAAITNDHVVVVTWACPSGDVLITLESPTDEASRRSVWVPLRHTHQSSAWLDSLIPNANAAKLRSPERKQSAQMVTVLCQKWLPNRFIQRRIKLADNRCVEEVINPRTGDVIQRKKALCEAHC